MTERSQPQFYVRNIILRRYVVKRHNWFFANGATSLLPLSSRKSHFHPHVHKCILHILHVSDLILEHFKLVCVEVRMKRKDIFIWKVTWAFLFFSLFAHHICSALHPVLSWTILMENSCFHLHHNFVFFL